MNISIKSHHQNLHEIKVQTITFETINFKLFATAIIIIIFFLLRKEIFSTGLQFCKCKINYISAIIKIEIKIH